MKKKIILLFIFITSFCLFMNDVYATSLVRCGTMTEGVPAKFAILISLAIKIIKYSIPIIIIIIGSIDIFKAITGTDSDMLAKTFKVFTKRLIAGALVFLIVTIFQTVISLVAKDGSSMECVSCFISNKGCEYYEDDLEEPPTSVVEGILNNKEYSDVEITTGKTETINGIEFSGNTVLNTKITSIDISKSVIGCDVSYQSVITSMQTNAIISEQLKQNLKETCTYIKKTSYVKNNTIQQAGSYAPGSSYAYPHRYGLGIDLFNNWSYTYKGRTYYPYRDYANSTEYRAFICDVCKGDETCSQNINYHIFEKIFKPKGWCWGGNWSEKNFDPMHYEVMKPWTTSCSTSNKIKIACN